MHSSSEWKKARVTADTYMCCSATKENELHINMDVGTKARSKVI